MRRSTLRICLFSLVLAIGVGLGCRKLGQGVDWGWRAERPADALAVFSHQGHKKVFAERRIQCLDRKSVV